MGSEPALALDACPLCRSVLRGGEQNCPDCGADLAPYRDIRLLASRYLALCRDLISRGDLAQAKEIVGHLPQLTDEYTGEIAELAARIAVAERDWPAANQALANCPAPAAAELRAQLEQQNASRQLARELYNYALTAARRGAFRPAAEQLAEAVGLDPLDAKVWLLKLKIDLKCHYFERCYLDLAQLDSLHARPAEFHRLEELLPPIITSR